MHRLYVIWWHNKQLLTIQWHVLQCGRNTVTILTHFRRASKWYGHFDETNANSCRSVDTYRYVLMGCHAFV